MKKLIYGHELLMEYKNGRREFSNIHIEVADLSNNDFHDIIIKDSKLNFTLFRVCNLKNAKFINCEIFFGGFRNADLKDAIFENCKLEFIGFERAIMDGTKIINCQLNWCSMLSTNINNIETTGTTFFRVFTDVSQLMQSYLNEAYENLGSFVNNVMDFDLKIQIMKLIDELAQRFGVENRVNDISAKSVYDNKVDNNVGILNYQVFGQSMENMITQYSLKNLYRTKSNYDK